MTGWIKRLFSPREPDPEEQAKEILQSFSRMPPEARSRWRRQAAAAIVDNFPKEEREEAVETAVRLLRKEAVRAALKERERQAVAERLIKAYNPEAEP